MAEPESVPFVTEMPIIEIRGTTVFIRERSGDKSASRAMSVQALAEFVVRAKTALQRHAAGDKDIRIDS